MLCKILILLSALLLLSSCGNMFNRLRTLGIDKQVSNIEVPHSKKDYKPLKWPSSTCDVCENSTPNSLWKEKNRFFFKDHKARNIGDIIKIKVQVNDKAALNNSTTKQRKSNENIVVPKFFGLQNKIFDSEKKTTLLDLKGSNNNMGQGIVDRRENIDMEIAGMVTQIFPNGNMVIMGSQEIKVNSEIRQLLIQGIVRPEDVNIDNTVDSSKIAELRVTYGGNGDISEMQKPRFGIQLLDIISPF